MRPLRVLLLTPAALPSVAGNATTAERWRRSLAALGHDVRVLAAARLGPGDHAEENRSFRPDVLHAHHASRAGSAAAAESPAGLPLVVSLAGTDLYLDLASPHRGAGVASACRRAAAIVAQSEDAWLRLGEELPEVRGRIVSVAKAFAWLGCEDWDLRAAAGVGAGDFLFFFPAGVRPVKGNLECLRVLEAAHRERPRIRAVFAGPGLDASYADRFGREVERLGAFARWLPPIPPPRMRAAYAAADAVLNASFAEGASNALLEAMAAGRPVLASDIPGNRGVLNGQNGRAPAALLFDLRTQEDFVRQALRLVDDGDLRKDLGKAGTERASRWPDAAQEAECLVRVYRAAIEGSAAAAQLHGPGG